MTEKAETKWQNWSRSLPPSPAPVMTPSSVQELTALMLSHSQGVRPVGSGHSWMPLVPTKHAIVKLDHFSSVGDIDPLTHQAWLGAGAKLHDLSPQLSERGYAFRNLGDIDVQTL
ncbi:MAG: FAD-binding protein, partial [Pseudomonadota bacterium]|nr:FAD-binding protein [Pseudomonadota bacterium]